MFLKGLVQKVNLGIWFSGVNLVTVSNGVKILGILVAGIVGNKILEAVIERAVQNRVQERLDGQKQKRARTLTSVFKGTLKFVIWISVCLMILPELGIDIAPILASLGVVGLAVGMGAKDIVSDFVAGLFILLEGQYQVGDKIKIAGVEGRVKEITLRRTLIQDSDQKLHSIPNSKVSIVTRKI